MNRWKSALVLPLALLLGGCVTYPTYTYRDDVPTREARYVGDDSYYSPAYEGYGDYYAGGYRYGSTGYRYYAPDYITYSAYYSLFWPVNRWYHDPYWYPGFYYGVTYFPRNYFSVSLHSGWRGHSVPRWGYGGAFSVAYGYSHWYSPYRYSWADSYYDWDRYRYQHRDRLSGRGYASSAYSAPRFGNARNQAERLAWRERELGIPARGGISTSAGVRAPSVYGNGRVPSRGADYGSRGQPRSVQSYQPSLPERRQSGVGRVGAEPYDSRGRYGAAGPGAGSRQPLRGRAAQIDGVPLPRGPAVEDSPARRGALEASPRELRSYQQPRSAPLGTQPAQPIREYREAPAREPMRVREYSSEPRMQRVPPAREFAPQQRFEPAAPQVEYRNERSGRGADFGSRSFSTPEPAPRMERSRDEGFRSAPMESRREAPPMRSAPSDAGDGGARRESRAREALQFD